jgi:hypothetical protein
VVERGAVDPTRGTRVERECVVELLRPVREPFALTSAVANNTARQRKTTAISDRQLRIHFLLLRWSRMPQAQPAINRSFLLKIG